MTHGKSEMMVDYTLNNTKAAKKKAIATLNDQSVSVECKQDNQVLDFSAGAYELFKSELLNYYEHSVDRKCTLENQKKDNSSLITENSYSIRPVLSSKQGNTTLGRQICRLSLYHTKCRVLINSRGYRSFMNEDLH